MGRARTKDKSKDKKDQAQPQELIETVVETKPKDAKPAPAAPRRSRLNRWIALLVVLMLLVVTYSVTRNILYRRVLYGIAQQTLNLFATGSVEEVDSIELTAEGNILVHKPVITHQHRDRKRVFYRAERIEIALDGWPVRDKPIYVSRVDLFRPEISVVREVGGDWNIVWALQAPPKGEEPVQVPPSPDPIPPPPPIPGGKPRGGWPVNGVHIHDGTIHITFVRDDNTEVSWDISHVNTVLERGDPGVRFRPLRGQFYGGAFLADVHVSSYSPFRMDAQVSIRGADAGRMAAGKPFIKRPISGRLDGVLAIRSDHEKIGDLPLVAGRIDITDGDLWDLPAFVGVLATLCLTETGDRKLKAAQLEFTVERDRVRIDRMNFLGQPVNLYGDGTMSLTGDKLELDFVPRIGKHMDDVIPGIGLAIQWLLNVIKGAFITIKCRGAFWAPEFTVNDEPLDMEMKERIEKDEAGRK